MKHSQPGRGLLGCMLVIGALAAGCGEAATPTDAKGAGSADVAAPADADAATTATPRRVLLVIADDLGVDVPLACNDANADGTPDDGIARPPTPRIDAICAGVRFRRTWATPLCSPTRATLLTGRYGFRTGVGWVSGSAAQLPLAETTLPELLAANGVATANIGKWHLGTTAAQGGESAPNQAGWGHFAGLLGGALDDYASWPRTVDGVTATSTTYATTANVDDALAWLEGVERDRPWLLWLAFNAPHSPFHAPPTGLYAGKELTGAAAHVKKNPELYYRAMIEAMDSELGRLLDGAAALGHGDIDVVFLGDNGTPSQVTQAPWNPDHAKGTLYQGGVHVPLCIHGPSVAAPGRSSDALVHTVDVFRTIAALFGVTAPPTGVVWDGQDLGPVLANQALAAPRPWNYTEAFGDQQDGDTTAGRAVTDGRYRLIRWQSGAVALYDLEADPYEANDLLAGGGSVEALAARDALDAILATLP